MSTPLHTCPHCGANLSLDQLRGTDCPYCRTAFAHHARAVEHAALVNQVMAQNMAAFAVSAPIVPVFAGHHHLQSIDAMRKMNRAITLAVFVAMAMSVGFVGVCVMLFA